MRLERDDPTAFADELGQEPREDSVVRADVRARPTLADETGDRRLKVGLVRSVALQNSSENRPHRAGIVADNLAEPWPPTTRIALGPKTS